LPVRIVNLAVMAKITPRWKKPIAKRRMAKRSMLAKAKTLAKARVAMAKIRVKVMALAPLTVASNLEAIATSIKKAGDCPAFLRGFFKCL
jgi:hypothetical protein